MDQVEVHVISLKPTNNTSNAFSLMLAENDKPDSKGRRMLVVIGSVEAQAIMLAMRDVATPRPLTHELLVNLLKGAKVKLNRIEIYREEQGVFFSFIHYHLPNDDKSYFEDARTSDAVAVAVRVNIPIYVNEELLEQQNKLLEECDYGKEDFHSKDVTDSDNGSKEADVFSKDEYLQDLERKLKKAVDVEDYESASWLRDKINEIKNGK